MTMKISLEKKCYPRYESLFWTPDHSDTISAWIEHIPFAFWLIEVLKPRILIELGVHGGASYFAFCQAVKSLNLDTACYGIDTWQGDEQAGFYNNEIFGGVSDYNNKNFYRFSTLIKSTFDDARHYFMDGSIDLLHIDGLHTYEAVRHDFESWLPKLSDNAIVLFHDINVRERNFGVYKLWDELKSKNKHFQFDFGHGLGILILGENIPIDLQQMLGDTKDYAFYSFLKNLFSERGNFFKMTTHSNSQLQQIASQLNTVQESNIQLQQQKNGITATNIQLVESKRSLELLIEQLEEDLKSLEASCDQLREKHKLLDLDNQKLIGSLNSKESENNRLNKLNSELQVCLRLNKQLLEDGQTEVLLLTKEIEEQRLLIEYKESELKETKNESRRFQEEITWYHDTYERKGLIGILKEKIKSSFLIRK